MARALGQHSNSLLANAKGYRSMNSVKAEQNEAAYAEEYRLMETWYFNGCVSVPGQTLQSEGYGFVIPEEEDAV